MPCITTGRSGRQLYASVGWWPGREEQAIADVLDSNLAIGAWDGDHLIGFARIVSDGHFRAFIEDVVVLPAYRGAGIGSTMIARLLEALQHVDVITLFCEPEARTFYERLGFRVRSSQMVLHRNHTSRMAASP